MNNKFTVFSHCKLLIEKNLTKYTDIITFCLIKKGVKNESKY